jgi:hypothetical protein
MKPRRPKAETFNVNSHPLTASRLGYTTTLLNNGKELITGGLVTAENLTITNRCLSRSELIDPATGSWVETAEMNVARYDHTAILLKNGKVLIAGGSDGRGHDFSSAELYDPATGKWTETGSMSKPRSGAHAVLQDNGKVLIFFGGWTPGVPAFDKELYDPSTGIWTVVTNQVNKSR